MDYITIFIALTMTFPEKSYVKENKIMPKSAQISSNVSLTTHYSLLTIHSKIEILQKNYYNFLLKIILFNIKIC